MFPPRIVGIIGNLGKMATNVVIPFFEEAGCKVIGSDLKNPGGLTNQQVIERSDLVYFSILPISNVAAVMLELIPHARKKTLWLHGTSIQDPVRGPITPVLTDQRLIDKEVVIGYLHFMFGPTVRSLRGQSIIYGFFPQISSADWEEWLAKHLEEARPFLLKRTPEIHDNMTSGSQVIPMLASLVTGRVWSMKNLPLSEILQIAGPAGWLQFYGWLRTLLYSEVAVNILVNHPHTKTIIDAFRDALQAIDEAIQAADVQTLVEMAQESLVPIDEGILKKIEKSTSWHIRLEGDLRGGAVCFSFSADENKLGLLTSVLKIFDEHGLDKTTCMAQEVPEGGCIFYVGLKDIDNPKVEQACKQVLREHGGEILTSPY